MSDEGSTSMLGIGAVSRATGIPAATLRTWERRYGFPDPQRNDAGHRLYDPEVVDRLRLTAEAVDGGHRPSNVVGLPESDLRERIETSGVASRSEPSGLEGAARASTEHGDWMREWLAAAEQLDGDALMRLFRNSWNRLGGLEFLQRRAAPFVREIGVAWAEKRLDVVHEHYTSEYVRDFLSAQWRPMSDRSRGPMVVCATPEGELHAIGLHLAATVLAMAGWRIVFLGPNTPVEDVASAVAAQAPAAVAVSISSAFESERASTYLRELADAMGGVNGGIDLLVGGDGAPDVSSDLEQFETLEGLYRWAFDRAS